MSEPKGMPPLGGYPVPIASLTCVREVVGGMCGAPATRHVIWADEGDNSLTCDEHYAEAVERWTIYDQHPVSQTCNLPDVTVQWSWDVPPGRCLWLVDEETMALATHSEMAVSS